MGWLTVTVVLLSVAVLFWAVALAKAAARADREAERAYRLWREEKRKELQARAKQSVLETLRTGVAVEEEYRRYLDAEEAAQEFVEEVTA